MVMPTELSTTNQPPPTDERVQGDLLLDYEQKFANVPAHLKLTKLCSNAGLANTVEKGQHFTTLGDTELDKLKGSCREYTLPRSDKLSQVKGWIRGNTKIGPVLDVAVSYHQGCYGVEMIINSLFGDGAHIEDIGESTEKPVAKASTSIPGRFDKSCLEVAKLISDCCDLMTRYLEKITEQSNSKTWDQYFVQNLRLLRNLSTRRW